ncbi:MAG: peptidase family protein [Acidimicrobiales bacterium]|nr:peptidase family protein [Acidimicrobiales bacterium]
MFPLESVLLPGMVLPLHVFETRYRALVRDCLADHEEFGVVLIERGSEVGGGDVRCDVGTMAHIGRAEELPDGRWAVVAFGVRRVRVLAWLPDDPYPRAEVEDWPDAEPAADIRDTYAATVGQMRRLLAMASELGDPTAPPTIELSEDPIVGGHQLSVIAPVGPLDRQQLLAAENPCRRLELLGGFLDEEEQVLRVRIAGG